MIPKSGNRFSEKIMLKQQDEAYDFSKKSHTRPAVQIVSRSRSLCSQWPETASPWPAVPRRNRLDLQILSRSLAAIGDLFIFHRLTFIERGQAGFLNCRNVNKNVLAARAGLDKSIPLGWVEPLDRTFRH